MGSRRNSVGLGVNLQAMFKSVINLMIAGIRKKTLEASCTACLGQRLGRKLFLSSFLLSELALAGGVGSIFTLGAC